MNWEIEETYNIILNSRSNPITFRFRQMVLYRQGKITQNPNHKQHGTPEGNRRQALKLILNYYNNLDHFRRATDEDWRRHLMQLENLCEEYNMEPHIRYAHFAHSLKPKSQAY